MPKKASKTVSKASKAAPRPAAKAEPARGTTAVAVAVAITALAPFVQPIGSIGPYTMRFAAILASAAAWLWAWAIAPEAFHGRRRLVAVVAVAEFVTLASALASADPGLALTWGAEDSLMGAPTWLALLAVFGMSASLKPTASASGWLRLVFAWGAVSALMVVWERASSAPQVTGGFGNANYAGAALVALVPLALFHAQAEPEPKYRPLWRYLALLLIAGVALAGSVSNLIALAVVLAGAALFAPAPLLGLGRRTGRRIALGIGAAVLLAALLVSVAVYSDVLPPQADTFLAERVAGPTVTTRLDMWGIAWRAFVDHPVFGVGPDGLQRASQQYLSERLLQLEAGGYSDYRVLVKDPHSLPLLVLASIGLVGLMGLAWMAFELIREARRLRAAGCGESRSWSLRCALMLGFVGMLVALLFMPWAVSFGPLLPLLAGLSIAGSGTLVAPNEDPHRRVRIPAWGRAVVVSLATFAAAYLAGAAMYGDSRVALALKQTSPEAAGAAYRSAARAQPTRPYVAYEALYADGFLASEGLASLDEYRGHVDAASSAVTGNAGFLANLVQPSLDQAYLTGRADLSWERERIASAAGLAPNHPDVVLEQAHLALLEGDTAAARDLLNRVERTAPRAPRYLVYRYYLAQASGDASAAAALVPRIEESGPGHARLLKGWDR